MRINRKVLHKGSQKYSDLELAKIGPIYSVEWRVHYEFSEPAYYDNYISAKEDFEKWGGQIEQPSGGEINEN